MDLNPLFSVHSVIGNIKRTVVYYTIAAPFATCIISFQPKLVTMSKDALAIGLAAGLAGLAGVVGLGFLISEEEQKEAPSF